MVVRLQVMPSLAGHYPLELIYKLQCGIPETNVQLVQPGLMLSITIKKTSPNGASR